MSGFKKISATGRSGQALISVRVHKIVDILNSYIEEGDLRLNEDSKVSIVGDLEKIKDALAIGRESGAEVADEGYWSEEDQSFVGGEDDESGAERYGEYDRHEEADYAQIGGQEEFKQDLDDVVYDDDITSDSEILISIIEQGYGDGDREYGVEEFSLSDFDSISSNISESFNILYKAYSPVPLDIMDSSIGKFEEKSLEQVDDKIKQLESMRDDVSAKISKPDEMAIHPVEVGRLREMMPLIQSGLTRLEAIRNYKINEEPRDLSEGDSPGEEVSIFGDKKPKSRKKKRVAISVTPSSIISLDINSAKLSDLSSYSKGFFSDSGSNIAQGIEDQSSVHQIEKVIKNNFNSFTESLSFEIEKIKKELVSRSFGTGGRILDSDLIGQARVHLNNLYCSLWVWDKMNQLKIGKLAIGTVNLSYFYETYNIMNHLSGPGRGMLRSFSECVAMISRPRLVFTRFQDEELSALFREEAINEVSGKILVAIREKKSKENIVGYVSNVELNRKIIEKNANKKLSIQEGVFQDERVVNNQYSKCPACNKTLLWNISGRGGDDSNVELFREKNFGNYKHVPYSLFREDGSLISPQAFRKSGPHGLGEDRVWKSRAFDGEKTWEEIEGLIYSGDRASHVEGVKRREEVLAYLGAESLTEGREVDILLSKFGCPFDSKDDHCGLAVKQSGELGFSFGWNGSAYSPPSSDDSNRTRLDYYGKRDGDTYYVNSANKDEEYALKDIAKKYGKGGFKFSRHSFSCPCRVSSDSTESDSNFLHNYSYLAIPHFGSYSDENINNYRNWRGGRSVGFPTRPDGSIDSGISDETIGYIICGASTSISLFDKSGEFGIQRLFSSIIDQERAGVKDSGRLRKLVNWLILNGVDQGDIHLFVSIAMDEMRKPGEAAASDSWAEELPPKLDEYDESQSIPASDENIGSILNPAAIEGFTDLQDFTEEAADPSSPSAGARTIRRPKKSKLIYNIEKRSVGLDILRLTSSKDIKRSARLEKVAEILKSAMAKGVDSEIYDILRDLILVCPNGHKFSVEQSVSFANNHVARKIKGLTRALSLGDVRQLSDDANFEQYKELGIIREVSDLEQDRFGSYIEWSKRTERSVSSLSFLGPDGKYYAIGREHLGNRGFEATAWGATTKSKAQYSFSDPIIESRKNIELTDILYFKGKSIHKDDDDSGQAAAIEGEMASSSFVDQAPQIDDLDSMGDAQEGREGFDEQYVERPILLSPIPVPARMISVEDTVRVQIKQLSVVLTSILRTIRQWRDRAIESSFNMAFAYPENICCTEDDYRTIRESIPEIIDTVVDVEDLERVSDVVFKDLKSSLFDKFLEGLDLNRIHLVIENYTYKSVSNLILENIVESVRSAVGFPDDYQVVLDTESDGFSNIANILFPLKKLRPDDKAFASASEGQAIIRKEFIGKLYMVAYAIELSRVVERYYNSYHRSASANYLGYDLPIELTAERAFDISEEDILRMPVEAVNDPEEQRESLMDSNGNTVGYISYDTNDDGSVTNKEVILSNIKSAYHYSLKSGIDNIDKSIFSEDVLNLAREYISGLVFEKIIEPVGLSSNHEFVSLYMAESGYQEIPGGGYKKEDRLNAISDLLDQARAIESAGYKRGKVGKKNPKLIRFLKDAGIDEVFYRNKTLFDAIVSSSQVASIKFRPHGDEWVGTDGQDYIQPYSPQIPASLNIMFVFPTKDIVDSDILNEGLRQNLRYSVVCVPSQDNGFLFKQKRGPVVGHYVISKERPIGKDTVEVEGAELAEFARVKRLYEVDVYREMIDGLQFKIWFVSITEYPLDKLTTKTYSRNLGHVDKKGNPKVDLKASTSSITDHPATEFLSDKDGKLYFVNKLFNFDSRAWQIGRVGSTTSTGAVFSHPVSEEHMMRYDSPVGITLPFDIVPSTQFGGIITKQTKESASKENVLASTFKNALPIADAKIKIEYDDREIDISFLIQKTRGAYLRGLSDIDSTYKEFEKELKKIKEDASSSAQEKMLLESALSGEYSKKLGKLSGSMSRLNYRVRTAISASFPQEIEDLKITDEKHRMFYPARRPSLCLIDPSTAYRIISGKQYGSSMAKIVPDITSEERDILYKFIVDVYGLSVIGRVFAPLMGRGAGSSLSSQEILNIEDVIRQYAESLLGRELTDDEFSMDKRIPGSNKKGTNEDRINLILGELRSLRPQISGKNLNVKKNNHLSNVRGVDPGTYYNITSDSTVSYIPVSVPMTIRGQEWKSKAGGWTPIDEEEVLHIKDVQRGYRIDEDGNRVLVRDSLMAGRIEAATFDYFYGTQDKDTPDIDRMGSTFFGEQTGKEGVVGLAAKMKKTIVEYVERNLKETNIKFSDEKDYLLSKISYRRKALGSIIKATRRNKLYKIF